MTELPGSSGSNAILHDVTDCSEYGPPWNCRIPSDKKILRSLSKIFGWIPSDENIRPSPETLVAKEKATSRFKYQYVTEADHILHTILRLDVTHEKDPLTGRRIGTMKTARRFDDNGTRIDKRRFYRNEFPYSLPSGTNHYIMWYNLTQQQLTEEEINSDIFQGIENELIASEEVVERIVQRKASFEFVWYLNPKMTIPDIFHVQVFWRKTQSSAQ
eukprot:gene4531-5552_t